MMRESDGSISSSGRKPRMATTASLACRNFSFEVGDEDRVGRVLDQALGVGFGLVELPHVAQGPDHADRPTVRITQLRGVQRNRTLRASRILPSRSETNTGSGHWR